MNITATYRTKKPFAVGFVILICIGFLLMIGKWFRVFNSDFIVINAEIHAHISNFSLSLIIFLALGYSGLLFGMKFRFMVIFGLFLIMANFVCETLMGFMNTPDMIDAIYGTIGTTIAFVFLLLTHTYGLVPVDSKGL